MVSIIRGTTQKPMASEELVNYFRAREDLEGYLYIGYPIIGTADGPYPIDAMYISREKGLVIFNLIENKDTVSEVLLYLENSQLAKIQIHSEVL